MTEKIEIEFQFLYANDFTSFFVRLASNKYETVFEFLYSSDLTSFFRRWWKKYLNIFDFFLRQRTNVQIRKEIVANLDLRNFHPSKS